MHPHLSRRVTDTLGCYKSTSATCVFLWVCE